MSLSTGTMISLPLKLALTCVSAGLYAISAWRTSLEMPEPFNLFPFLEDRDYVIVGAVFGLLVLGPYATWRGRLLRIAALTAIAALTYDLSVGFVTTGPFGHEAVVSYVLAGTGAALICCISVLVIGPARFSWLQVPIWLFAGLLGGAMFKFHLSFDRMLVVAHAAWQLLVCIGLHVSFHWLRPPDAASARN